MDRNSIPENPADDTEAYVGQPVAEAEERARDRGWTTVRRLPPNAVVTMEFLAGRINFAVTDGEVVRCWTG
ncbi:I78 family peptidase inhibitor [Streptomyces sp. TP-A0874]|uniref:I78 family peptidase inhibitor n=1 Tax=Streptomyces sp. TP-A0874 TaxID=549819 RepID=UPI000852E2F5|nr:I78 family peptidase inhibitor [Streptomyces sp. TP-A0874]